MSVNAANPILARAPSSQDILDRVKPTDREALTPITELIECQGDSEAQDLMLRSVQDALVAWVRTPQTSQNEIASRPGAPTRYPRIALRAAKTVLDSGIMKRLPQDHGTLAYLAARDRRYGLLHGEAARKVNDPDLIARERATRLGLIIGLAVEVENRNRQPSAPSAEAALRVV
jgi:hypothetical protein